MRGIIRSRGVRVALLAICGIAVTAGVGAAAALVTGSLVDGSGAYHGCVNSGSGVLRVIAPGDACHGSEIPIDWNRTGPAGPPGPPGPAGAGTAYRIVSQTFTVDNGAERSISCAADEHVTGGGASSAVDYGGGPSANGLVTSYPSGPQTWSGYATGIPSEGQLTLYAVCAK